MNAELTPLDGPSLFVMAQLVDMAERIMRETLGPSFNRGRGR